MNKILETIETDYNGRAIGEYKRCMYLADDNRKCAIGLFMNEGNHQRYLGNVLNLMKYYGKSCLHTLPTNNLHKLMEFQKVHDDDETWCSKILNKSESFELLNVDEQKMMLQFSALYLFEDEL